MAYVGTFQPYEGLDVLVRALPTIIAARPDVQLLIVGAAAGDNHDVESGAARADRSRSASSVT